MKEKIVSVMEKKCFDIISNLIKNKKWQLLFADAGESIISHVQADEAFRDNLQAAFSEENMNRLAKELKNSNGYDVISELRRSLRKLMMQYEIPEIEAETYTHHFIQFIISDIRENDHEKGLELALAEISSRTEAEYQEIIARLRKLEMLFLSLGLNQKKNTIQTLNNIEQKLVRESKAADGKSRIDLDFFELDDEEFASRFEDAIQKESVYVVGPSREETLYRILSEIKKNYNDRPALVAECKNDWEQLSEAETKGCILIPAFFDESVSPIPGNTNIFIYHTDEPCYAREKLTLRRRTRNNLVQALVRYEYDHQDAYRMVEATNGIYAAMKRRLFNSAERGKGLPWVEKPTKVVLAALLCENWTDWAGDRHAFEALSGQSYDACMDELNEYSHGENPFIVEVCHNGRRYYRLASPEDAWVELQHFLTAEMWKTYVDLLYEAVEEKRPSRDEYLKNELKRARGERTENEPKWSETIRKGFLRTLTMRTAFDSSAKKQCEIDWIVFGMLQKITAEADWREKADYFPELCQASPEMVLNRLENEIRNPTGMREIFAGHKGGLWDREDQYVSILWAVEQLIQQKRYIYRAIKWLLEVDGFGIKYKLGNNPEETLSLIFCSWLSVTALRGREKIQAAREAVKDYPNAWRIIINELPGNHHTMSVNLNTPAYRPVEEPEDVTVRENNECLIAYLGICTDTAGKDPERWCEILKHLTHYEPGLQQEVLSTLAAACGEMDDSGRTDVKEKLRETIYRQRYFTEAVWHVGEDVIGMYEETLNAIPVDDPVFDYLYLMHSENGFPLLHPTPSNRDDFIGTKTINGGKREEEIREKLGQFKRAGLSIERLIELALAKKERYGALGEVLAQFYCENKYDDDIFTMLMQKEGAGAQAYRYIHMLYYSGDVNLPEVVQKVQTESDNVDLLIYIISVQIVENPEECIIFHTDEETKKSFWNKGLIFRFGEKANAVTYEMALTECLAYGNIGAYAELLHAAMKVLNTDRIYDAFMRIDECRVDAPPDDMTGYHLEEVLKNLQEKYLEDDEKNLRIAQKEWYLGSTVEWEEKRCTQHIIKRSPELYAYLVSIVYKRDPREAPDPEKQELVSRIYPQFSEIRFCPAERDGKVDHDELKAWADGYRDLLKQQGQEWLWGSTMGELLANSPEGEDGNPPCEAVRMLIEENYSNELGRAYLVEIKNKRGVYTVNAGLEERALAEKYRKIADALNAGYPRTAGIYYEISREYLREAEEERQAAENGL